MVQHQPNVFRQIAEGFRYVGRERHIRALLWLVTVNNFFMNAIMALIVLYGTREIGFRPGIFGLAVSVGGFGAVIGSIFAQRLGAWLGPGPFVIYACGLTSLPSFCFPLISRADSLGIFCLTATYFALSAAGAAVTVFAWTIRQSITPSDLLGQNEWRFSILRHWHHAFWRSFRRLAWQRHRHSIDAGGGRRRFALLVHRGEFFSFETFKSFATTPN